MENTLPVIKKKKKKKKRSPFRKTITVIGTVILSLFLIVIITGSIVATALTVYVMKFMDTSSEISLDDLRLTYTTFFYAKDKSGNYIEVDSLSSGAKCIWVNYENIPQHVRDAFQYSEDERFWTHDGVDFKRTFSAFANEFLHFADKNGGSTVTQQLIKNITGDDEVKADRKIREIFRAINLERNNSKDDILEAYLNIIALGANNIGVQSASNYYFDKDVSELSIAEASCIAAITKSPTANNPMKYPKANKERQKYVLTQMLDNGAISTEEYDTAIKEELVFIGNTKEGSSDTTSYFVDATIEQAIDEFMKHYGITYGEAEERLLSGGYKIYMTVDLDIQAEIEAKYKDPMTFSSAVINDPPQSAFIAYDYNGNVLAVVGGIGEKPTSRCLNRVSSARSPGSCIKPLASYGPSISLDLIHWSSIFVDEPITLADGTQWPKNFSMSDTLTSWTYQKLFTFEVLQKSLNTAAAQLVEKLTPKVSFDFMTKRMHFSTLELAYIGGDGKTYTDVDYSPMAVGALTKGTTLQELVAEYQIFGNLGKYNAPTYFSSITDAAGNVVIQHKYINEQILDEDTAYVMNRLMKTVIDAGTGKAAKNSTLEIIGKTGTSQNWNDLLFVGCTPSYVAGVWYGYDQPKRVVGGTYYSSSSVWNNVFGTIADKATIREFVVNPNVLELRYCKKTGLIASDSCTDTAIGYYKPSNVPVTCNYDHTQ